MSRDLYKKILWFFDNEGDTIDRDDLELLQLGFFNNEGKVVFENAVIKWRDFREFLDSKK